MTGYVNVYAYGSADEGTSRPEILAAIALVFAGVILILGATRKVTRWVNMRKAKR